MNRRVLAVAVLLIAAACAHPPVEDQVTIEPWADDTVLITAQTKFEMKPANDLMKQRVESARAAALSGTDPWAIRFGALDPIQERLTILKDHGDLDRVTRAVRIKNDDLQQVFSDTNITADILRGEGWNELRFYTGSGGRATREQQRQFDAELAAWSEDVARYFTHIHHLYTYLNGNPERAQYVFAALLEDDAPVLEEEQPLVDAVLDSMANIADKLDAQEGRAATFGEEADLIFNPFPGRIIVRTPRDVISSEGFTKDGKDVVIEPVNLAETIGSMQGTWISPDPLAALLRDQEPTAASLASAKRKSTAVVTGTEIVRALREQLTRPREYIVRWHS